MTESSSRDDAVRQYVRTYLRTHTREGVVDQLVASGHDRNTVEKIWDEEWISAAGAATGRQLQGFALLIFVICGVVGGATAFLLAAYMSSGTGGGSSGTFLIAYAALYVGGGLALWWATRWSARRFRIGQGTGLLVALLLFAGYGTLMFGGCLAAAGLAGA
jgi:hypothetical protein